MRKKTNKYKYLIIILSVVLVLGGAAPLYSLFPVSHASVSSWNSNVSCRADVVTVQNILGSSYPSQSLSGSSYQTSSTAGGVPNKRALSPPCILTNTSAQTVSSFVQINGLYLKNYFYETRDCNTSYDAVNGGGRFPNGETLCDSTGNVFAAGTSSGYVHIEFDRDWMAKGYCGPGVSQCDNSTIIQPVCTIASPCSSTRSIDVQGFVYWDPEGHWELHPFTAWRISSSSPDFSISASPTGVSALAGAVGTSAIAVAPINGFTGTVSLAATISPAGLACALNPTSVMLGSSQTTTLSCNGPAGTYTVTVTGTSGSLSHSTSVTYTITDFSISVSPASISLGVGGKAKSTITISPVNGFTGTVNLTNSVSPSNGLSCSMSTTSITSSGTSTLTCSSSSDGLFAVTVTGTDSSLSHLTIVTYNVTSIPDFSITASPSSLTISPGATGNSIITITSINGFTGTVSLAAVSPSGLVCSLSPSGVVLGASQSSTLSCSGSGGSYGATVTGTSGSLSHSATVNYNVPDFAVTASPATVNTMPSISGMSTITVTSLGGLSGNVSLGSIASSGLTASLDLSSLTLTSGGNVTATLTVGSAVIGNYSATVTGASGSLSHSVSVSVILSDFSIAVSPSSLSLARSSTASSLVTLTSLNGFDGTVTLSASISPSGPKVSLSNARTTLAPNGSATSTLTVRTLKRTLIGTYTVTITATSGSVSRTIQITTFVTG